MVTPRYIAIKLNSGIFKSVLFAMVLYVSFASAFPTEVLTLLNEDWPTLVEQEGAEKEGKQKKKKDKREKDSKKDVVSRFDLAELSLVENLNTRMGYKPNWEFPNIDIPSPPPEQMT